MKSSLPSQMQSGSKGHHFVLQDKQISDLYQQIQFEALRETHKNYPAELTLMEMLNSYDQVINYQQSVAGSQYGIVSPSNEIQNQVYRLILKNEREKTFESIKNISEEITTLKSEVDPHRMTRNDQKEFEFQGSFGGQELKKQLFSLKSPPQKENIKRRSNLPKISLDSVLEMQKNESFINRYQKMNQKSQSKKTSPLRYRGIDSTNKKSASKSKSKSGSRINSKQVSNDKSAKKHKFKRNSQSPISPYRSTSVNLYNHNKDLIDIVTSPNSFKSPKQKKRSSSKKRSKQLPRLNFSGLIDNDHMNDRPTQDNAIDSNRAIAFAYYTRRLMLVGWRSLFNYRLEKIEQKFFERICHQKLIKNLKKRVIKGFYLYAKQHQGHGQMHKSALNLYKTNSCLRYLHIWEDEYRTQVYHRELLLNAQDKLNRLRKQQLLRSWRSATLELQLQTVQEKTALHIYKQRYQKQALLGLRIVVDFRLNQRRLQDLAQQHSNERVLRKSITSIQMYRYIRIKEREMDKIAHKVYEINVMRQALRVLKSYHVQRTQYNRLRECAENYHRVLMTKTGFEILKLYQRLSAERKQVKNKVDSIYQTNLKIKLLRFIRQSNKWFRRTELTVYSHMHTRYQSNILHVLKNYAQRKHLQILSKNASQMYLIYYFLQNSKTLQGYEMKHYKQSVIPYYNQLNEKATSLLKRHICGRVLMAWSKQVRDVKSLTTKRLEKQLYSCFQALRSRSLLNQKYRYLFSQYRSSRQQQRLSLSFESLKRYRARRHFEREITSKFRVMRDTQRMQEVLIKWALKYKKATVKRSQKEVANEIAKSKQMSHGFQTWRNVYLKRVMKNNLQQMSHHFRRQRNLKKYFSKMLNVFYSLQGLEQILNQYRQRLRLRLLKKSVCGLLQNVLTNNHNSHQLKRALTFKDQTLLCKSLASWKIMMPELRQKNALFRLILNEKNAKRKLQALQSMQVYQKYRVQKRQSDHFMVKALSSISTKRFFSQWRNHLQRRVGLKMLDQTWSQFRTREFFSRAQRKIEFEEQSQKHMLLFNAFKLLEFTFNGLKRKVSNNYLWAENTQKIAALDIQTRKAQFLRIWREQYEQDQYELRMAQFSLIQIKNIILRKYFDPIKKRYILKSRVRKYQNAKSLQLRNLWFSTVQKITQTKVRCGHALQQIQSQQRIESLEFYFQAWINEYNEVQQIGTQIERNGRAMKREVFEAWKVYLEKCRSDNYKIDQLYTFTSALYKKAIFQALIDHQISSKIEKSKLSQMTAKTSILLQKSYLKALRLYMKENLLTIKNRITLKKKFNKKAISKAWSKWLIGAEDRMIRVRVMKALCMLSKKVNTRYVLNNWIKFANSIQEMENRAIFIHQVKQKEDKKNAIARLHAYQQIKKVDRERDSQVTSFYHKKIQYRLLSTMRFATTLLRKRRLNKVRACQFRKWQLQKKSICSFAITVQRARTFRILTLEMQNCLVQINGPNVFKRLRINQLREKEKKIRQQFADGFFVEKIFQKVFKAIYWHMVVRKDQKLLNTKGVNYNKANILQKGLYSLKLYKETKQVLRNQRQILTKSIQNVDRFNLLISAFSSFQIHRYQQQERICFIKLQLMLNEQQRIFTCLKNYATMKKSLRLRKSSLEETLSFSLKKHSLFVWFRKMNIEMKTRKLDRQRLLDIKSMVIAALERHRDIQQLIRLNLTQKVKQYLSIGFHALHNHVLRKRKLQMIQSELQNREIVKTVQKTFMGLHYQCLIQKNTRLMQTKLRQSLIERSFQGWKYNIMLEKTKANYVQMRNFKDLSFFFSYWLDLQRFNQDRKTALTSLVTKKDRNIKGGAITMWKRSVFQESYLQKLQKHILVPYSRDLASRCLKGWRRYAKFRATKLEKEQYLGNLSASLTAQKYLRDWFSVATADGGLRMKMRIMAKKIQAVSDSFGVRKAVWKIADYGNRESFIKSNLDQIHSIQRESLIVDYFGFWRHRFAIKQINRVVVAQSNRKLQSICFAGIVAYTRLSKAQKAEDQKTLKRLQRMISPDTYFALAESFFGDFLQMRAEKLKAFYFQRLVESAKASKIERHQLYKAAQFNKYKLYLKYFFALINFATENLQKTSSRHRALNFWRYRVSVKVLKGFVMNTLKQRKYKNANSFYNSKICSQALHALAINQDRRHYQAQLNTKMMRLLKKKCVRIFQISFAQWRIRFQQKVYQRQAIEEFQKFRDQRLLKVAFNYFTAVCEQQKQIKDMTYRAKNYFKKRRHFKLLFTVLQALKAYANRNKSSRVTLVDKELQALRFYAYNLQMRHLKAWKKEIQHHKKRQMRSKLYTIFSSWKFYVKERSLLKMYLKESNEASDPSLMSTLELRENCARISDPRSILRESMSSASAMTPFRSAGGLGGGDRIFNRIDGMILNAQSPSFSGGADANNKINHHTVTQADEHENILQRTGYFSSEGVMMKPVSNLGAGNSVTNHYNYRYSRM